ncbi:MAG: phosphatidate cytidylyltransferase [Bacilli bacterium]|nr:phosphatidate cytidylyltransferase [Bacilli bacterium]
MENEEVKVNEVENKEVAKTKKNKHELHVNKVSDTLKKSMITRTITAVIMVAIGAPAVIFGGFPFLLACIVVLFFMIHEFINAPSHDAYGVFVHMFIYVITFSFAFWNLLKNNLANIQMADGLFSGWSFAGGCFNDSGVASLTVSTIGVVTAIFVLFFLSICDKNFAINDVTYLFTMSVFIGIGIQAILFLRNYPEAVFKYYNSVNPNTYKYNFFSTSLLIFYVFLGTFITDIGAYFTGVLFGKRKMNTRISPKKTWEGFVGGIVFSFIISLSFAIICWAVGYPIIPMFDLSRVQNWVYVILLSLSMPLIATLGDFIFSALKRNFGIKDYGTLLKGHGGFLDRFDSFICAALFTAVLIIFINNGWNFLI